MAVEVEGECGGCSAGRSTIGGVEEEERREKEVVFMDRLAEEDMGVFRRRA